MRILFCSSEAYPFSKSGGLADMASALPKIMNQLDQFTAVISPLYDSIYSKLSTFKLIGEKIIKIADESFKADRKSVV